MILCNVVLCLVFEEYEKITEMTIEDSIKHELSGDFERLMLAVGRKYAQSTIYTLHCQFNTVLNFGIFPHSPVRKECSHVLCQAPLQVDEGKQKRLLSLLPVNL